MNRRYAGNVYDGREKSRKAVPPSSNPLIGVGTAHRATSQSVSNSTMNSQNRGRSLSTVSTASSRASERRVMGIIDIDEDEDEFEELDEERRVDGEYPRLLTPLTRYPTPSSKSRQSTSNRAVIQSRSPVNDESKRFIELERRVRVAEGKANTEQRTREMIEREVRDLQSSLYAPIYSGGRKSKGRPGEDDDLDEYLLQYAIKQSRAVDVSDGEIELEDHMLRYVIKKSKDGMCSVTHISYKQTI